MSHSPLVSIITPTFNRAKLVAEAIESVLKQTYSSWELIIWDDGSTDETPKVLQSYSDPRIHSYRGTNGGQAFAMNQALARATGKFIALLDDDDKWLPGKLARQVEILERFKEADILFANFENFDAQTGRTTVSFDASRDVLSQLKIRRLEARVNLIVDGFPENFLQRNFILPSSTVLRKCICDATGPFNEKLKGTQDKDYWWRCALRAARFAYVEDVLVVRRKGEDSFTASGERSRMEDIRALDCCLSGPKGHGRGDLVPVVERAIGLAWENMGRFYLEHGRTRSALAAFRQRCRYGITTRALLLAVCSLFGPTILRRLASAHRA